jgi:hypothetical protein
MFYTMGKMDTRARDMTTGQQISNAIVSEQKCAVLNTM